MLNRLLPFAWLATFSTWANGGVGNLTPAEALQAFETEPGFVVELVAAEPLVIDPVALAFDESGRLYVAENRDYPLGAPDGTPLGIISRLEDTDGDGRMDRRIEFATGIRFPNGVLPWRDGVIVTAAPEVLWLRDTDGDGRADRREILLNGFSLEGSSQLRVNDPTLGPDGWIYLAGGLQGGDVFFPADPSRKWNTSGADLRFQPDTGALELIEGKGQYGLAFDEAGNRFTCMNRVQIQHAPLASRYLARNPRVAPPGVLHNCPAIEDNKLLTRYSAGASRVFPISANITTADSHEGTYSAACAVHVYRGTALPAEYRGAVFSCDPTANLVRADRLEKTGGTFAALRIHEGTEALRSRDNWFRPVFLAEGPDGALYVADMYRGVIEHPEYLPDEVRKRTRWDEGTQQGRIWRLRGLPARKAGPPLETNSGAALARELTSEIPWRRDTAFRLLVERADPQAVPVLRDVASGRIAAPAGGRIASLRLLKILAKLDEATVGAGLASPVPEVRQVSLLLAEPWLGRSSSLTERALALADDPDPQVRFQAALSLPLAGGPHVGPALARIGLASAEDAWTRAAVLCGVANDDDVLGLLKEVVTASTAKADGRAALVEDLSRYLATSSSEPGGNPVVAAVLRIVAPAGFDTQAAAVLGLHSAGSLPREIRESPGVVSLVEDASRIALADEPLARRERAILLIGAAGGPDAVRALPALLTPSQPAALQSAVVRALVQPAQVEVGPALLEAERWQGYAPGLRTTLLGALLNRPEFWPALLDAIESETVPPGSLNSAQRERIRTAKEERVRTRAEKLLAGASGDRQQAYETARAALALPAVGGRGQEVFRKHCASCHRFNREGVAVGPDLFDIRNQPKEVILLHLVIPEQEIAPNFVNYDCETQDGRSLNGLLARETATSITLRQAQGMEETIPRTQVVRLTASPLSLMPQELEKGMSQQELADLLAYLRGEQ